MSTMDLDLDQIIQEIEKTGMPQQASPAGLRFNPFPVSGIASGGEKNIISPVDAAIIDEVRKFLIASLTSGQFTGMIITGDFGLGKTHLLRWIEHVINAGSSKIHGRTAQAYYVSNPGIRPMDVLMAVTKAIGEEDFRRMLWALVADDLQIKYKEEGIAGIRSAFGAKAQQPLLSAADEGFQSLLTGDSLANINKFREHFKRTFIQPRSLREYVNRVLGKVATNLDVINALTGMLLDDEMHAFASWVALTSTEGRQQLRVPQQDYFEAILNVIKRNGVGAIFLLIDEFEDVVGLRLSNRQRAEYLATLRLLIDAHVDDFSLVVALAPQAWELTKSIHPAFADRVGRRVVDLRPLNAARAEQLVKRYLAIARLPERDESIDSLAPFTPEAVKALVQVSQGNTRAFVTACYRVLQQYWSSDKIDESAVRSAVSA